MVRFPYILEVFCEESAVLNPDGSWLAGRGQWRRVGRCNARQNSKAQQIKGHNGDTFLYTFEVVMPSDTQPIAIGSRVRIIDNAGRNIFDMTANSSNISGGCKCCNSKHREVSEASYTVQGFYKSGQRYEYTKIWL